MALAADHAQRGVITHSSGNHGTALALAAQARGLPCYVVVPDGAPQTKVDAIAAAGAQIRRCPATVAARQVACTQWQAQTGAHLVHPFENPYVIAGQGTAALELLSQTQGLDAVVVPVGGGGLASGTAVTLAALAPTTQLFLAEPSGADDAFRSLREGVRVSEQDPDTFCDGLRTTLGRPNFAILQRHGAQVLPVSDAQTRHAMHLLWRVAKQLIEPSSATVLAAVLAYPQQFAGQRVGLILSGGNVDLPG